MPEPTAQDQMLNDPVKQPVQFETELTEPTQAGIVFTPQVDILETEDELILLVDMPGVELEGTDIQFEGGELMLHGRAASRYEGIQILYREYEVGDFHRSFRIGPAIDSSKISAQLTDGVLTIHLPKSDAVKPRRIEVTAG